MNNSNNNEASHYLRAIVKSSLFILLATIISKIASYGYRILLARYFGSETYGLYSLAVIIITILSSIATLGLGDGLVRYVSFYRGRKNFGHIRRLVYDSRNLFLISSILCNVILILFAPLIAEKIFHNSNFTPLLIGMSFALPFILLSNLYLGVLRGFERIKTYSSLINIYQNSTRFILLILLVLMGVGIISVSISYVLVFLGLFVLARYYAKKDLDSMPKKKMPSFNKVFPGVLSYAWPLLFVGILYSVFYWTDSLLLGYFFDAENVGWYNSAVTLISLFGIAPDIFMQLLFPLISFKLSEGKKEIIKRLTKQVTKWIYLVNIPLFLMIFFFSEQWLAFLFKPEFFASRENLLLTGSVLKILCLGAILSSITGISTSLISIKGKTKLVLKDFLIFSLINITLNLLFIPIYGMIGAAVATIITQFIFMTSLIIQVKRIYGFNLLRGIRKRLILLMIFFLIGGVYLIKNFEVNLILSIILSIIMVSFYVSCLYFFRLFDSEDFDIIKSILKKTKAIYKRRI